MADTKISGLSVVTAYADTQEFPVNDSGTTRKITGAQLRAALPQGTLGYLESVANQAGITTLTDLTGLSVTVTVGNGRRIRITGRVPASSTVTTDGIDLRIRESSGDLMTVDAVANATDSTVNLIAVVILTPTPGAHTYVLSLERRAGTGTVTMSASGASRAFIHVEDVGV